MRNPRRPFPLSARIRNALWHPCRLVNALASHNRFTIACRRRQEKSVQLLLHLPRCGD